MPVRLGFIGTGGIANHHLRTLSQIENAELSAFSDVVTEKAAEAATAYGGTAYPSPTEMLDKAKIDAVYICVPPFAHGETELAAIARGLPIFVEKPVANTAEKADEIAAALQAKNLVSAVGYHWRYMDTTDRAREILAGQPVGYALGAWTGGMPGVDWWRVLAQSGGQMVEQTTHIFDLARYLMGPVKSVHAFARTGLMDAVDNYSVHDASVTNLLFANGAIASITSSCILSCGGHVGLDLYLKDQVLRLSHGMLTRESTEGKSTQNLGNNPTLAEDKAFVDAVASGDPAGIRCNYAEATESLKLTLAATRSAQEGNPIEL